MGLRTKLLAGLMVVSAGSLLFGRPAGAVQTTTWGIEASPTGNGVGRATLDHPANGQTVHDSVIVYNRTAQPIVVDLSVLDTTYSDSAYQYTTERTGLAASTSLAADVVHLGPRQQAQVPVTIKEPRGSKTTSLAAIAAESAPVKEGAFLVQQRLVVLVKATPSTHVVPLVPELGLWGPVGVIVLAGVTLLVVREVRRNRGDRGARSADPAPGSMTTDRVLAEVR